jgi:tetratricopeptide (TPR) repeat protein
MSSAWIRVRGDRQAEVHRLAEAASLYRLAVRIDPQNWKAHHGLGDVFYTRRYNQLDPAEKRRLALQEREAFAEAYRLNVKKEEVVYGLGRAELFLGNRNRGLDLLRQAADYKRFNDFYWRKVGIELRKAGLYEEALERFEYARKLHRGNKTTRRNIEWLKKHKCIQGDPEDPVRSDWSGEGRP